MLNGLDAFDPLQVDESLDVALQRVESELLFRGAHVRLCGRSSLHHRSLEILMLLQGWKQPPHVQLAGTLFQAYGSRTEDGAIFSFDERETVRDMVGAAAERLIYRSSSHGKRGDGISLEAAPNIVRELAEVAIIEVAAAACTSAPDGAPAEWLRQASTWAASIAAGTEPLPIFQNCTALVSAEAERALLAAYLNALAVHLRTPEVIDTLRAACECVPWIAEPFVLVGVSALALKDAERAAACGERAVRLLRSWNNAWDKRLLPIDWLGMANMLSHAKGLEGPELSFLAGRVSDALQHCDARPEVLYAQLKSLDLIGRATIEPPVISLPTQDDSESEWNAWRDLDVIPPRFAKYIAGLRENHDSPAMPWYPDVDGRAIWDVLELDVARELQLRSAEIASECAAVDLTLFQPSTNVATFGPEWRLYPILEQGTPRAITSDLPVTTEVLRRHANQHRISGSAFIARLAPASRTAPHRESSNFFLRCMLALDVAEGGDMIIEGVRERFRNGHCIVVSESAVRQERNAGNRDQVLLIVQLWHPDLTVDEIVLLEGLSRLTSEGSPLGQTHREGARVNVIE